MLTSRFFRKTVLITFEEKKKALITIENFQMRPWWEILRLQESLIIYKHILSVPTFFDARSSRSKKYFQKALAGLISIFDIWLN